MRSHGIGTALVLTVLLAAGPAAAGTPVAGFTDTAVVAGLTAPTAVAFLPDGRMLVTQKAGALRLVENGVATTLLTIPVCPGSEMGLLGIAIDPDFAQNGFIYLYRTKPGPSGCGSFTGRLNQVVRVTMAGGAIDPGSLVELLSDIRTDNGNHDGGALRIGPDAKLYVGVGDTGRGDNQGGPGSSTNPYAQDLAALEGKVLRLELDGSVPDDNPFVGEPGVREEIFAYGFRNPFRFGFDPLTGRLWVGDVGDLTIEEITIVGPGENHSWPYCEGHLPAGCQEPGDVAPIFTYPHSGPISLGTSITGGAFAGASFRGLEHDYFFGDFTGSALYHVEPNAARNGLAGAPTTFVSNAGGPVDIVFGPDGALYYVAFSSGEVRRVAPIVAAPASGYLCYRARLAPREPRLPKDASLAIEDQIIPLAPPFSVKRTTSICNPASMDGGAVTDPDAHQQDYAIKRPPGSGRFLRTNEVVSDAFGTRNLTLIQEEGVLVPSSMVPGAGGAPPYEGDGVDHYKCYRARAAPGSPRFVAPPPSIVDAFHPGGQSFLVKRVTRYCNPAAVDGAPIENPNVRLVCYRVRLPAGVKFTKATVSTSNPELGEDLLIAIAPSELCVPAALDD